MSYKKIIFVDKDGTSRSVMSQKIFEKIRPGKYSVLSRGLIVAFSEPVNPKASAVLASDGVDVMDFESKRLIPEDIDENTAIFAIDKRIKDRIISSIDGATEDNTFEICRYIGEELELLDPYGGQLTDYGICYESLKNVVEKLVNVLEVKDE